MRIRRTMRGQPLVALLLVLGAWVGVRAWLWDAVVFAPGASATAATGTALDNPPTELELELLRKGGWVAEDRNDGVPLSSGGIGGMPKIPRWQVFRVSLPGRGSLTLRRGSEIAASRFLMQPGPTAEPSADATAANQLLQIAVLQMPLPMRLAEPISERAAALFSEAPQAAPQQAAQERSYPSRWSGDGWLLLRQGGDASLASGPAPSTYGASQAGAVLRYRLAPTSDQRPSVYVRTTAALNGSSEREAALGLSARPFAGVPVITAAELRATEQGGGTRLRPAVTAFTELPPFALPYKFRGEAYAQAGYVGGRNSTAFADGQLRIDRGVAAIGRAELRAGAGAWGGAQKGASRLDLGPGATMGMGLGKSASARVALDWRFRIAGDATPTSGPAVTLSAGF